MNLKAKLISSVSMFVLVLALLVVSVFALRQESFRLGGTISFEAKNVYAEITGTISGQEDGPKTLPKLEFSNNQTPDTSGWANGEIVFDPNASPIQIKIEINVKNLSEERALYVKVEDLVGAVANLTKSVMVGAEDKEGAYVEVLPLQSVDYVISLSPTDEGESVTGEYNYLITLIDESEAQDIEIQANPNQESLGSVTGGGSYDIGDTVELTATHFGSNYFLAWATSFDPNEMEIVSTSETYSFELTMDSPRTYYALFNQTISTSQTVGDLVYTFHNEAKLAEITGTDSSFQGGDYTISPTVTSGDSSYRVYSIGSSAFYNCSSLTSITIPEGVTSIGQYAFSDCSSLTSITIPEGVTSIGTGAFQSCSSLTEITIPEGVTSIGDTAFIECSSLTSITIPEGVTSIGNHTFAGCSNLTEITIPEGVISIGDYAFVECSSLTEITINGNISTLGSYAFSGCRNLTKLTLGAGVTSIPSSLFTDHLTNLNEIVVEAGSTLDENIALPTYVTWYKGDSQTPVTSFDGEGTYSTTKPA